MKLANNYNRSRLAQVSQLLALPVVLTMISCQQKKTDDTEMNSDASQANKTSSQTFGQDATFLKKHTDAVVLTRGAASIVVVPEYQGRVMTTTARGDDGPSSGWINYDVVEKGVLSEAEAAGKLEGHMYAFGGEERFWMGPEGGQYSIFFAPGKTFEFDHWFTPDAIDNEAWKLSEKTDSRVVFKHQLNLQNHSGTRFNVGVERTVTLLDAAQLQSLLKADLPAGVNAVAYQSENKVTNQGDAAWEKDSGLLSIWMLCMFQPSPTTTVFIPFQEGSVEDKGPIVNSDYFGAVPPERLKVEDGVIYFKADGKQRGKIGVPPGRSQGVAGSYDSALKRLTLLIYKQPKEYAGYVNSMWEMQEHPYQGDAINSYNDGPVDDSGEQMGPFYELESSSPALPLQPAQTATHTQTIIHLYGDEALLQQVLSQVGKVDLAKVKAIFPMTAIRNPSVKK
jgi:hypothetical protein